MYTRNSSLSQNGEWGWKSPAKTEKTCLSCRLDGFLWASVVFISIQQKALSFFDVPTRGYGSIDLPTARDDRHNFSDSERIRAIE